jgi:hypothetical protein
MLYVYGTQSRNDTSPSLWELLKLVFGAKYRVHYTEDDFAEEYFVGPFIVSYDVVNDWCLFVNHKQQGYVHIADLNWLASIFRRFGKSTA